MPVRQRVSTVQPAGAEVASRHILPLCSIEVSHRLTVEPPPTTALLVTPRLQYLSNYRSLA